MVGLTPQKHRRYYFPHLLRKLTNEVLGELLQLIPLQPRQRLRDWGAQADCRGLEETESKDGWGKEPQGRNKR